MSMINYSQITTQFPSITSDTIMRYSRTVSKVDNMGYVSYDLQGSNDAVSWVTLSTINERDRAAETVTSSIANNTSANTSTGVVSLNSSIGTPIVIATDGVVRMYNGSTYAGTSASNLTTISNSGGMAQLMEGYNRGSVVDRVYNPMAGYNGGHSNPDITRIAFGEGVKQEENHQIISDKRRIDL